MVREHHEKAPKLKLPTDATGTAQVRQLKRDLEAVEEFVNQHKIREPGQQPELPKPNKLLESLATDNGLNLLQATDRKQLKVFLESIEKSAPRLHFSFAVAASQAVNREITTWLRQNVDPNALLEVGLQPAIAAGCIVRTSNKVFDFSLRHRFQASEGLLEQALEKTAQESAPTAAQPAQEAAAAAQEAPHG